MNFAGALEEYKKNPCPEILGNLIREYNFVSGESQYELLDDPKFADPYRKYLEKNYPNLFKEGSDFKDFYGNPETSVFDLEYMVTEEANLMGEDYDNVFDLECLIFSRAMFESGLGDEVVEILSKN